MLDAIARTYKSGPPRFHDLPLVQSRIGGWPEIAGDKHLRDKLGKLFPWAADNLQDLAAFDRVGRGLADGSSLVHYDLYVHNILLTVDDSWIVDWPHAQPGNPLIDVISVLSHLPAYGVDPTARALNHPATNGAGQDSLRALLAALSRYSALGALTTAATAYQAIVDAKQRLTRNYIAWLQNLD